MNKKYNVLSYIPPPLDEIVAAAFDEFGAALQEIRFRLNKPICISADGENLICMPKTPVNQSLLSEIFMRICENSVYKYQNDINNGFVTVKGGNRVGIIGEAVYDETKITAVKNITSINFRIARDFIGCSDGILKDDTHNILIVGPPSSGKTTLLRDLARAVSNKNKKVCIVDERYEISGGDNSFYIGDMTDVMLGYKKPYGITLAVRTMSPQTVVFDEIGTAEEYESIKNCFNCGVDVITSVHAYSYDRFSGRPLCKSILDSGFFDTIVYLGNKPGRIIKIKRKVN